MRAAGRAGWTRRTNARDDRARCTHPTNAHGERDALARRIGRRWAAAVELLPCGRSEVLDAGVAVDGGIDRRVRVIREDVAGLAIERAAQCFER
jgi:hypothetical protein